MFDWLYAIPLAVLILGSGITYVMSSSLFGPFCIIFSIIIAVISQKRYNRASKSVVTQCTGFTKGGGSFRKYIRRLPKSLKGE